MNIVIAGAGNIGQHLAKILSKQGYGVTLIDTDAQKLEQASKELDLATRVGSGVDAELLEELLEYRPELFISLTNDDETNLVSCTIAKSLGYLRTIARVRNQKYFQQTSLYFERLFSVDHFIGPEILTAEMIASTILAPGAFERILFAHGAIELKGIKLPLSWEVRSLSFLPAEIRAALIYRPSYEKKLIFPQEQEFLLPDDEVLFVGEKEAIRDLPLRLDLPYTKPASVTIVGGSLIGQHLAHTLLEKKIQVTILEKDLAKARLISELLPAATVFHHDACDPQFLKSEELGRKDVCISATGKDEINLLSSLLLKELGCKKTISTLIDTNLSLFADKLGISMTISPREMAVNTILSIAQEKSVCALFSFYENSVEIIEVKVGLDSKITGIPIAHLQEEMPKDLLFLMIQSRGRIFNAQASRILSPGDTVVIASTPQNRGKIKELF